MYKTNLTKIIICFSSNNFSNKNEVNVFLMFKHAIDNHTFITDRKGIVRLNERTFHIEWI